MVSKRPCIYAYMLQSSVPPPPPVGGRGRSLWGLSLFRVLLVLSPRAPALLLLLLSAVPGLAGLVHVPSRAAVGRCRGEFGRRCRLRFRCSRSLAWGWGERGVAGWGGGRQGAVLRERESR